MSRNVSMQFGRSGGVVQNRPGWKFIRGAEITDNTTEVLSFAPGGIYILISNQWTASSGARQGRQVYLICAPEEDVFGTTQITSEALATGGTSRVTYTRNNDSTLSMVQSSSAYNWRYALYRVDGAGGGGERSDIQPYIGVYSVTPSTSPQSLSTANKRMTADVEIDPIPSDYGHIAFDGSVMTVE